MLVVFIITVLNTFCFASSHLHHTFDLAVGVGVAALHDIGESSGVSVLLVGVVIVVVFAFGVIVFAFALASSASSFALAVPTFHRQSRDPQDFHLQLRKLC